MLGRRAAARFGALLAAGTLAALALTGCTSAPAMSPSAASPPTAPSDFVLLSHVDPSIQQEMRYWTSYNFVGRRIDGYDDPECVLTREAADALRDVQSRLRPQGYGLEVYDCYRPQKAVDQFVRWSEDESDVAMKRQFYPTLSKSRLFPEGYIAAKSGHSRGSTVDVTLVSLSRPPAAVPARGVLACEPQPAQVLGDELDMGTGYDCFSPLAHTGATQVTPVAQGNRRQLVAAMEAGGFTNYDKEWWHYTLKDEPYPDSYFDFDVRNPLR